jgi:rhodanese-related sulfurtransferase
MRSLIAIQILKSAGFQGELLNFEGGTLAWVRRQWPLERG